MSVLCDDIVPPAREGRREARARKGRRRKQRRTADRKELTAKGCRWDTEEAEIARRRQAGRAKAMRMLGHRRDKRYTAMTVQIMGHTLDGAVATPMEEALLDTGAGITLFSSEYVSNLRRCAPETIVAEREPDPDALAACGAGGHPLVMEGDICVRMGVGGVTALVWGQSECKRLLSNLILKPWTYGISNLSQYGHRKKYLESIRLLCSDLLARLMVHFVNTCTVAAARTDECVC